MPDRFLSGYQLALVVGAVIVAVGVPVSLFALRRTAPVAGEPGPAEPGPPSRARRAGSAPQPSLEAL